MNFRKEAARRLVSPDHSCTVIRLHQVIPIGIELTQHFRVLGWDSESGISNGFCLPEHKLGLPARIRFDGDQVNARRELCNANCLASILCLPLPGGKSHLEVD